MRLIDADEVKKLFSPDACISTDTYADKAYVRELIDAIPTIEAVPTDFHDKCQQIEIQKRLKLEEELKEAKLIRHGKWEDKGSLSCHCSECGCKNDKETPFCPHCGAKMDERI